MVRARFFVLKNGLIGGFKISGHASFADLGKDIVCSAVSSSVRMCCNGLVEVAKIKADVLVKDGSVSLKLSKETASIQSVQVLLKALEFELSLIAKDYGKNITLIKEEI